MDKCDLLVVTPTRLRFETPLPHTQIRRLCLMNPSNQTLLYQVQPSVVDVFTVQPACGKVRAFDTAELIITLQPITSKQQCQTIGFAVKSMPEKADAGESANWLQCTPVNIALYANAPSSFRDDSLRLDLQLQDNNCNTDKLISMIREQYKPVCFQCMLRQQKATQPPRQCSCWRWFLLLAVLGSGVAYSCWERLADPYSLMSEQGF